MGLSLSMVSPDNAPVPYSFSLVALGGWRLKRTRGHCRQSQCQLCCHTKAVWHQGAACPAGPAQRACSEDMEIVSLAGERGEAEVTHGCLSLWETGCDAELGVRAGEGSSKWWSAGRARAHWPGGTTSPWEGRSVLATGHPETKPLCSEYQCFHKYTFPVSGHSGLLSCLTAASCQHGRCGSAGSRRGSSAGSSGPDSEPGLPSTSPGAPPPPEPVPTPCILL